MTTSIKVRSQLLKALQLDLVGPTPEDDQYQEETLTQSPTAWYLTGFLSSSEAPTDARSDQTANEEIDRISYNSSSEEETTPDKTTARKGFFPVSIGLSFLLSAQTTTLEVITEWGDYTPLPVEEKTEEPIKTKLPAEIGDSPHSTVQTSKVQPNSKSTTKAKKSSKQNWQRIPKKRIQSITLDEQPKQVIEIPDSGGLQLVIINRAINYDHLVPPGTRSVSVFLVNNRHPQINLERDQYFIFQASLTINSPLGFVPRPNLKGQNTTDWDEKVADLQYRNDYEFVVGHNVSAYAHLNQDNTCQTIKTAWLPQAEVEKVIASNIANVELTMETIAAASDAQTVREMIGGIVTGYAAWITQQSVYIPTEQNRAEVAQDLLNRAQIANQRIAAGLKCLDDPQVLEAFCLANRAIATAIRQRLVHETNDHPKDKKPPKWRPFQLAFILMNLLGIAEPTHEDRECVDLLFFPTGGGKTEAYLGLAAFTLILRRLRNPGIQGAGVSVIMRYTLRLLTLDQLSRAATLICALELERQQDIEKLGRYPFEIGLWVGQSATPNKMGEKRDNNPDSARARTIAYKNDSQYKPAPIPIENCPWCGTKLTKDSFNLIPNSDYPRHLVVKCTNRQKRPDGTPECTFLKEQSLPIVAVDECIYARLPCFIIATVDKFANLPWVGNTAALFGKVNVYDEKNNAFSRLSEGKSGEYLKDNSLYPPDLIIQDELHLISGPLGTMVGLYETAIEALCSHEKDGKVILPKIIASTATVRRASRQIRALFGRTQVDIFPPPGINRLDSFFAKTVPSTEQNARLYLGIAAQGRSLKVVLLRTYLALLGVAQKEWKAAGGENNPNNGCTDRLKSA